MVRIVSALLFRCFLGGMDMLLIFSSYEQNGLQKKVHGPTPDVPNKKRQTGEL